MKLSMKGITSSRSFFRTDCFKVRGKNHLNVICCYPLSFKKALPNLYTLVQLSLLQLKCEITLSRSTLVYDPKDVNL